MEKTARRKILAGAAALALISSAYASADPFHNARELEKKGRLEEAFLAYLTIPGAEYTAAVLSRSAPEKYLNLLSVPDGDPIPASIKLIEGDLHLATGDKTSALACYRAAAALIAKTDEGDGKDRCSPATYYPVEPTAEGHSLNQPLLPFTVGPGSHRDNWLIRRFIALDAMDDAEREFERIWTLYQQTQEPHVVLTLTFESPLPGEPTMKPFLTIPGYDGKALQFVVDYAYFLSQRGEAARVRKLLLTPLLVMERDVYPGTSALKKPISEEEASHYPKIERLPLNHYHRWHSFAGLTRNDYVRLVYGEFKRMNCEHALIEALQEEIDRGEIRNRRTLARVLLLQNKPDEAIRQELAYIAEKKFPLFTATYRRGMVFEDYQLLNKAVAEYEALLMLTPGESDEIPDPERQETGQRTASIISPWNAQPISRWTQDVIERLERIYVAQGETEKLLNLSTARLESNPKSLEQFDLVQDTAKRFRAADRTDEYVAWAIGQSCTDLPPTAKANLYWSINDPAQTLAALKECENIRDLKGWKPRLKDKNHRKKLLDLILVLNPADSETRLQRLDMENNPLTADTIDDLEKLLAPDAKSAFPGGKGSYNGTQFRDFHNLAYRLARLYEKEHRIDDLLALGLRVAEGTKPFSPPWAFDRDDDYFQGEGKIEGDLVPTLALLIQHADTATLELLEEIWRDKPDFPSKRQLARRLRGGLKTATGDPIPWANLPQDVEALASSENVLSLAADERFVYSGHPWGVAVYNHEGNPVVRVALGAAALHLQTCGGNLWIGTPLGLNRVDPETWNVAYLPMDQDIPPERRNRDEMKYSNNVTALATDGDFLWIGTRRDIRRLDIERNELRIFSKRELGSKNLYTDWRRLLVEENYVWAEGRGQLCRYDRKTGVWSPVAYEKKRIQLIGEVEGRLFGDVMLDWPLGSRPCLIDRETLEITPILIHGNLSESQRRSNGPSSYYGTNRGKPVFGFKHPGYAYDAKTGKLHAFGPSEDRTDDPIESPIPAGIRQGTLRQNSNGDWFCSDSYSHRHTVFGRPFNVSKWSLLTLPTDVRVLGGKHSDSPRYEYGGEDWPFSRHQHQRANHSGGLHFISADGQINRVSSRPAANVIPADAVFSIASHADGKHLWLCTDAGVALLDTNNAVTACISRLDGARANRVTSVATLGTKTYFSTEWGHRSGGLMILDTDSSVFTSYSRSDGLACEKIDSLSVSEGKLKLTFGVEYGKNVNRDHVYFLWPDGSYDPVTQSFAVSGAAMVTTQNGAGAHLQKLHSRGVPTPYLGGRVISEQSVNGTTYVCGTRGLLVTNGELAPPPPPEELAVSVVRDETVRLVAEAKSMKIEKPLSLERLQELLEHENPYVHAEAFCGIAFNDTILQSEDLLPLIGTALTNDCLRTRTTAVYILSKIDNNNAIPLLQQALADPDIHVRGVATIQLCRRGKIPEIDYLKEILEQGDSLDHPYGAASYIGVLANQKFLFKAVAPHATAEVFALLMKHPLSYRDYDYATTVYPPLGESLIRHPEAAKILLKAYDEEKYNARQRDFSLHVFQFTGTNLLTTLHAALKSNDRVVRSNAARACGVIGDPSSTAPLMDAMDLESGLSRASIVWALGELRAKEALPMLETLYVDVRNDEERARHAGYRAGQRTAAVSAQYVSMRNIEVVGKDWNELKATTVPKPIDPMKNEELISTEHIVAAIGKIDPVGSQEFYRTLAGDPRADKRRVTAEQLALAEGSDRAENIPILRAMLADADDQTRIIAAASLLILGNTSAEPYILEWLNSDDHWIKRITLEQLQRIINVNILLFAKAELETIAETDAHTTAMDYLKTQAASLLKKINEQPHNSSE